jgi:alpha-mannosidase
MLKFDPFLPSIQLRLKDAIVRLAGAEWTESHSVGIEQLRSSPNYIGPNEATTLKGTLKTPPFRHGKLFDQTWFRLHLPEVEGEGWWMRWERQGESTLFIDGSPYCGFDFAHREFALRQTKGDLLMSAFCCQSPIWSPHATGMDPDGARIEGCTLSRRDERVWKARISLLVIKQVLTEALSPYGEEYGFDDCTSKLPALHGVPNLVRQMMAAAYEALNAFDADQFEVFENKLDEWFKRFRGSSEEGLCTLTGHAHIDLVWLWPERMAVQKAIHSMATVDYLLERYPNFHFGYSQPQSYRAIERACPSLGQTVKKHIASGRWEATGALWVESDMLLTCGEALVRSFTLGQAWFSETTGSPSRTLWLPDCFGFGANLPQIAKLAGVENFFTMKTGWRTIDRFPFTSFRWLGVDGSELLAHTPRCIDGYYNGDADAKQIAYTINHHAQSTIHNEVLAATGFGDGGGGPTEEQILRAERLSGVQGYPELKWGRIDDFYQRLAAHREELPVYHGEISIQHHRGVFTTHHELKAKFRAAEKALQTWEAVRVVTGEGPIPSESWDRLVFAQFHDYIPGSSIMEVYDEAIPELHNLAAQALEAASRELSTGADAAPSRFNPLPEPCSVRIVPKDGEPFRAILPPLTGRSIQRLAEVQIKDGGLQSANDSLSNNRVKARFNEYGEVSELMIDGQSIALAAPANQIWIGEDKPHAFKAWDIDQQSWTLSKQLKTAAQVVDQGVNNSEAWLTFERRYQESTFRTTYTLAAGSIHLEIEQAVDWQTDDKIVRAIVPTTYTGDKATFGAPYGSVQRSQRSGEPEADASWEVPASRWAALRHDDHSDGCFIATESKYGFCARESTLSVTLLRSCQVTGSEGEDHAAVVPSVNRRRSPDAGRADIGHSTIRYIIGRWRKDLPHPTSIAATAFTDPLSYQGGDYATDFPFETFEETSLRPEWVFPMEKGWGLRAYECEGRQGEVDFSHDKLTQLPNLLETKSQKIDGPLAYRPHQILSLHVER